MKWLLGCLVLLVSLWGGSATAADAVLSWTPNTEADLAGYKIYRANMNCAAAGPLFPVATVGKVTSYLDANLPPFDGTMCWEITAIDTAMPPNESNRSNRVSKVLNTVPPQAPAGLGVVIQ